MEHPHRDTRTSPSRPQGKRVRRATPGRDGRAGSGKTGDDHRSSGHSSDKKQQVLTKHRASVTHSIIGAVAIKHGDLAMFSRSDGMLPMGEDNLGYGLYARDCRFLNGYEIRLAGDVMEPLGVSEASGDRAVFALSNREIHLQDGTVIQKDDLGVTWERVIRYDDDRGQDLPVLHEHLTLMNYGPHHVDTPLSFAFSSAFEDIFEIRGLTGKARGTIQQPEWDGDTLHLAYSGTDDVVRRLRIHFSTSPASVEGTSARFQLSIAPRANSVISISLTPSEAFAVDKGGSASSGEGTGPDEPAVPKPGFSRDPLRGEHATEVRSDSAVLDRVFQQSIADLEMLRGVQDNTAYTAAGIPWFIALFGRDSLIASLQQLAFNPGMAETTLRLLARYQAREVNDWRDEEPGKILHELRVGELARRNEIPQTPYYGTVDSTPLFLILIGEHAAWTGELTLFHDLRDNIERALDWIDTYGDSDGDGFIDYQSRVDHGGLANQGWKDSGNAIVQADGSLAQPPIALVEVQGYVYKAKRAIADLFERAGEPDRAAPLRQQAGALRDRFNRAFWLPDQDFAPLALQAGGKPAAVVSSNPGQALWTGIVADEHGQKIAERLLKPDMFSGWGIRTLSSKEVAFNPVAYHLGTVWPHDNAIIGSGLRNYGFDKEFLRVFAGLLDAASHFHSDRLPELFSGYRRDRFKTPVDYPVACHPQAWAAGSIPMLLVTALGLHPDAFANRLRIVRPLLPPETSELHIRRLRVGAHTVDLRFAAGKGDSVSVDVESAESPLEVTVE